MIDIILQGLKSKSGFGFFFENKKKKVGLSEGCSICGRLKSKLEQEVCSILCEIVGIGNFFFFFFVLLLGSIRRSLHGLLRGFLL